MRSRTTSRTSILKTSASSLRSALALTLCLTGQPVAVTGRLLRGPNGAPLAGHWVVLHQVAAGRGAPVDSARTDQSGRYVLRVTRSDTSAMYVVSGWYQGIAYFSQPVELAGRARATVEPLVVYDTSTTGPAIRVARRLVTIARPRSDGARDVLEFLALENPGTATRVASDTVRPTWTGALPPGALQFQVGEGDVSPQAVSRHGDSVVVFAPLAPGGPKQLTYAYVLPATVRRLTIPIDQWTGEVELLLEDTAASVAAPAVESLGVQTVEQRAFARYRTGALAPGAAVAVALPRGPFRAQSLLPLIVLLFATVLLAGLVIALRRPAPLAGGGTS